MGEATVMRRNLRLAAVGAVLGLVVGAAATAPAIAMPTASKVSVGRWCPKVGVVAKLNGYSFRCEKWGTQRWVVQSAPGLPKVEISYIKGVTRDILEDLRTAESRYFNEYGLSSALGLLSDSYYRLVDVAEFPPDVVKAKYASRADTLGSFAEQASDDLYYGYTTDGYAKYEVIRKETRPLLAMINASLGTNYTLPSN